jgi:hypothetical protein
MRKLTNTLSPSPNGFQSPKFLDSHFREVRGLGLGRPKSSEFLTLCKVLKVYIEVVVVYHYCLYCIKVC